MQNKKAFTLIEMIFVILISALLAIGSFKAMKMLYLRSAKAKAITDMTLRSQIVLDQIGVMLYNRVPNSVIGYTNGGSCEAISDLSASRPILEWLATKDDELLQREYDGFIDMGGSDKNSDFLDATDINASLDSDDINLVFAGAFDEGAEESTKACEGAFGWHGNDSNLSFDIDIADNNITIKDNVKDPEYIYEKYYLTDNAYAIARGADLQQSDLESNCDSGNYIFPSDINFTTTLFLFYDYQPFKSETFCGDSNGSQEGNVSILATDIHSFEAIYINNAIRINLDMNKTIRGSKSVVHISKQKVIL